VGIKEKTRERENKSDLVLILVSSQSVDSWRKWKTILNVLYKTK